MLRQAIVMAVVLAFLALPLASSHVFNHEDRHEVCEVYGPPQDHFVGDGHAHTHDPDVAAAANMHNHDPCKQIRMDYPDYESNVPISELSDVPEELGYEDLIFSDGDPSNTEVFVGGEAYQFPIEEGQMKVQQNLVVLSDLQAAGMGFPGSGTHSDPYIVEGYIITGNMVFKDTSKCFVIRNNVIVDRSQEAPLLPDPEDIIVLADLIPFWEDIEAAAQAVLDLYAGLLADWEAEKAQFDADKAAWLADKADLDDEKDAIDAELADMEAQEQQWQDDFAQFEADYFDAVQQAEWLADDFEWYANEYGSTTQPTKPHESYVDYVAGTISDIDAIQPYFEAYQEDADGIMDDTNVEGWIFSSPPPDDPPSSWPGSASSWEMYKEDYAAYQDDITYYIADYWNILMANEPDQAAYEAFLVDLAAVQDEHAAFMVDYNAFMVDFDAAMDAYDAFMDTFDAFMDEYDAETAAAQSDLDDAAAFFLKEAQYLYEYAGQRGTKLYNTLKELIDWLLELIFGIIDPGPGDVNNNNGQLVLDWTGQCIHAYHNVINDLRVNQNNDRTGYATGGMIEDNRIYTIGQIRHYDGIFRQNEVGDRSHLHALIDPTITPAGGRTVNNDGANQGWYYDNVIYGQIDLDFHGHHHSAGFFSPESHYHGSTQTVAYMQASNGACTATHHTPDPAKANGPHADYPTDNDIDVLGETVLELADDENCLPHMDHGKRWTSVFFNNNIVIDPFGVGLRFEDENHRADDEQANSENMRELKQPHFHQKWVQLEENVVVGKIFIDVLNAEGTDLWSDDWSEVQNSEGIGRTTEAVAHPGAEIINSHPYRNDAWLDVQGNTIFLTQSTGVLVIDADDLELFQLRDNRGVVMPTDGSMDLDFESARDWLAGSPAATADALYADVQGWGGADPGVQTFASLHNVRDAFTVEHCNNVARGLDRGFIATDRIIDDGQSAILACGTSDWGTADPAVSIAYTPAQPGDGSFSQPFRDATADTDDFYVSELAFDVVDGQVDADTWDALGGAP